MKKSYLKRHGDLLPLYENLTYLLNNFNLAHLLAPLGAKYMIKEYVQLAYLKAIFYRALDSGRNEE
jgi:hypothetical protein